MNGEFLVEIFTSKVTTRMRRILFVKRLNKPLMTNIRTRCMYSAIVLPLY